MKQHELEYKDNEDIKVDSIASYVSYVNSTLIKNDMATMKKKAEKEKMDTKKQAAKRAAATQENKTKIIELLSTTLPRKQAQKTMY
eukprot:10831797-Ditylum_brightwellii.AAC.1